MKWLLNLSVIVLLAASCSAGKDMAERKEILRNAKETNSGCFVIFKDGRTEFYKTLILKTSMVSLPYLLADGKIKITREEVEAYQTENYYAVSQLTYNDEHSKVAIECLPGFAVRIAKGNLNVYDRRCLRSSVGREFYIQAGANKPIYEYSPDLMNAVIKYHYEAYNYFNKNKKTKLLTKIYTTADLFNNAPSYTKK